LIAVEPSNSDCFDALTNRPFCRGIPSHYSVFAGEKDFNGSGAGEWTTNRLGSASDAEHIAGDALVGVLEFTVDGGQKLGQSQVFAWIHGSVVHAGVAVVTA
jgi:hypothetical protein